MLSQNMQILLSSAFHNTPIADGGQIQGSSYRAIRNGVTLKDVFEFQKNLKNKPGKPLILMGYYNLIYQYCLKINF